MKRKLLAGLACSVAMILVMAGMSQATPIQWASNGHYYEIIQSPNTSWDAAKTAAETMTLSGGYTGHLVTITSAEENQWLTSTFGNDLVNPFCWIGAYQTNPMLPIDQGWAWVTGESWAFNNWASNEPNDYWEDFPKYTGQYETVVHFWGEINSNGMTWADTLPIFGGMSSVIEYEQSAPVPEPATMFLLGSGLIGLIGFRKKFKK